MGAQPDALLSANIRSVIQIKSARICRSPGFSPSERLDIQQELMSALVKKAHLYDPSRGASFYTWASRVLDNESLMIMRDRHRLKRAAGNNAKSLERGAVEVRGEVVPLAEVLTDADKARLSGASAANPRAQTELAEAMERALAELPPAVAAIAEALKHGTAASVAKRLNLSRRQVDAAREQIAAKFRQVGLDFTE